MQITTNTGEEKDTHDFCKCGNDYGGDRIFLEDEKFVPIIDGERQHALDFSDFFINIKQSNIIKFKLASKASRIIKDIDGTGIKFLAISVVDPTKPIYWRKVYENPLFEYITAILNGSFKITTAPFTQDRVNANIVLTLNSDNTFKTVTWANIATQFIDGQIADTWANAPYSWSEYHPLLTTNTKLVVVDSVTSIDFVIEQDLVGNFIGEVVIPVVFGSTQAKITLKFHGVFGTSFIIDSLDIVLDGHLVGTLFIQPGTLTTDFITTPLQMEVNYSFLASSGLIEEYDKIVGMMVLTSTNNEPIQDIKLFNNGTVIVQVEAMLGS